jgi:hypothetical protein
MVQITGSLAFLALASSVIAQTTTVSILLPGFTPGPLEGSVVAVGGSLTTYTLNCPASLPQQSCQIPGLTPTVIAGPSTLDMVYKSEAAGLYVSQKSF